MLALRPWSSPPLPPPPLYAAVILAAIALAFVAAACVMVIQLFCPVFPVVVQNHCYDNPSFGYVNLYAEQVLLPTTNGMFRKSVVMAIGASLRSTWL